MSWLSKLKPLNVLSAIAIAFFGAKAAGASDSTAIQQAAVAEFVMQFTPAQLAAAKGDVAALRFVLQVAAMTIPGNPLLVQAQTVVTDMAQQVGA